MALRIGYKTSELTELEAAIQAQSQALIASLPPDRLYEIKLSCTCDRCVDPWAQRALISTPPPEMEPALVAQYFGGVGASGRHTDEVARLEAEVFLTHVIALLSETVLLRGEEARLHRQRYYFLDPDYLVRTLLDTGIVPRLGPSRRSEILACLGNVCRYAAARSSRSFETALCYFVVFGGDLPGLVAEFRAARPLRHLRFWTALAGGSVGSHPDRRTTGMDFHLFLRGMPRYGRDELLAELESPDTVRVIERFAFSAKDPQWLTYLSRLLEWRDMTILATRHSSYKDERP